MPGVGDVGDNLINFPHFFHLPKPVTSLTLINAGESEHL